jgi:hypothetical protein
MEDWLQAILGAQALLDWFGYWPSFHDAEVLSIDLNRIGPTRIRVHAFAVTGAVDSDDSYVCDKHCIVTLLLEDLEGVDLVDFNQMNVLSSLKFQRENDTFVLTMSSLYGVGGSIKAKSMRIELTLGIPQDSQYKNDAWGGSDGDDNESAAGPERLDSFLILGPEPSRYGFLDVFQSFFFVTALRDTTGECGTLNDYPTILWGLQRNMKNHYSGPRVCSG